MSASLQLFNATSVYLGYAYSYPHKSAYRELMPSIPLTDAWTCEPRDSLFLYLHVPFCEYRCGFCNLFTYAGGSDEMAIAYLDQVRREASVVRDGLADHRFSRVAFGGGTPTFLEEDELEELLAIAGAMLGASSAQVPASCEVSPATLTRGKAHLLRSWGIERISIGVQSFDDRETRGLGRPQAAREVANAIQLVREAQFPILNLDLIYGAPGQTLASWLSSLEQAIRFEPEEMYLYPLYIRELTGLGKTHISDSDQRIVLYRAACDVLRAAGYEQKSMRMFQRPSPSAAPAPVYCCQTDGMVGLGCGARSYTRALHYSTEFAVGRTGVRAILSDYLARDEQQFSSARYGILLNPDEQRRRYVIQSLLQSEGLLLGDYRSQFRSDVLLDLPQLADLVEGSLATIDQHRLNLTAAGLERSDQIGPWLYSECVRRQMEQFECC
jgi:oxygen-independent coproporphyrinogen-3 oxidase